MCIIIIGMVECALWIIQSQRQWTRPYRTFSSPSCRRAHIDNVTSQTFRIINPWTIQIWVAFRILRLIPTGKYLLPSNNSESNQRMSLDLQKAEEVSKHLRDALWQALEEVRKETFFLRMNDNLVHDAQVRDFIHKARATKKNTLQVNPHQNVF